ETRHSARGQDTDPHQDLQQQQGMEGHVSAARLPHCRSNAGAVDVRPGSTVTHHHGLSTRCRDGADREAAVYPSTESGRTRWP
ncbi:hypothetical protein B8W90_12320, partial [Staphylococcus hominis]